MNHLTPKIVNFLGIANEEVNTEVIVRLIKVRHEGYAHMPHSIHTKVIL